MTFTVTASYSISEVQEIHCLFHWLASNWVGPGVLQMTVTESCHVVVTGIPVCIQLSGNPLSINW